MNEWLPIDAAPEKVRELAAATMWDRGQFRCRFCIDAEDIYVFWIGDAENKRVTHYVKLPKLDMAAILKELQL